MKTHNFVITGMDTDSIAFSKPDGAPFSEEEQISLLNDLNSHFPEKIKWEHDGVYQKVCILKAKNYILVKDDKLTKKGSSLKSSKIEPRLKDFMDEIIDALVTDRALEILNIYNFYIREVNNLTDISGYCSKRTITEAVLNPERTNEQKVFDALNGANLQMGDKIYVYYTESKIIEEVPKMRKNKITGLQEQVGTAEKEMTINNLSLKENWQADHSVDILMKKLYNTLVIFENVINIENFPKYHLKGKKVKEELRVLLEK